MPPKLQRFEYHDNKSSKFWEISLEGDSHIVCFGRIGAKGQIKTKSFADSESAAKSCQKLIDQKVGKGYRKVTTAKKIAAKKKSNPGKSTTDDKTNTRMSMKLILDSKTVATKATAKDIDKLDFTKSILLEKPDGLGHLQWFVDDDDDSISELLLSEPGDHRVAAFGIIDRAELARYFKAYLKGDKSWMKKLACEDISDVGEAPQVKMKLNLAADQRKFVRYLKRRIRDYPVYDNLGPGNDDDPITLITVGFYAEQGGYANVIFDTRKKADADGQWTLYIDNETNTLSFPKWLSAYEKIWNGHAVAVTQPDGTIITLHEGDGDEGISRVFGDMLLEAMIQMRDDGTLSKLPLTPKAFMVIEEFDGRYSWPTPKTRKTKGRIKQ